jgi:hypothetical protein
LRAPGTATELQDEERYLAMFREANGAPTPPVRSLPRRVGRLGAGGTAVVVTVALTSGVAAAYTGHLPDPVQELAHSVIGAPAPDSGPAHHRARASAQPGATLTPRPSSSPASSPGVPSAGSATPTAGAVSGSHPTSPDRGTAGPSGSPSPSPSSSGSASAVPSALTLSATTHRVAVGEGVTFTGQLVDVDGAALPDHPAVLQVRGPQRWRPVAETTTDDAGTATVTTPPLPRSAVFRWHTDHRVHSTAWLVQLVPSITASARADASGTSIAATTAGARVGDRAQLFKRTDHGLVLVRRGRLDTVGGVTFPVVTPRHRTAYVVRLPATQRHAGARARVVVVPPAAARLTISAPTHRVVVGGTTVVSGVVSSADGTALRGHPVVLQRLTPTRWRVVGRGVSDAQGAVALSTPPIVQTGRYRLRTDHGVHSTGWRVVEVPTMSASASRTGTSVVVGARVQGGRAGDTVVLLRRLADGGLVRIGRTTLGADGGASFTVPARRARTTYVVRLPATKRHGVATARAVVRRASR